MDLRAAQVLPLLLQVVGTPSDPQLAAAVDTLQDWVAAGAHRIDRDQDGQYEHPNAIQIMDAWWPRLLEAEFEPEMGAAFFDARARRARLRQRAEQPRRAPRQRLPGRLVGLRLQGPAPRAGPARVGRLLAHLLRQRLADRLPRRAAPGARRCARRAGRATLYDEDQGTAGVAARRRVPRRQERPVVLRLGPLPADRRRHRPHDPLDQPAHLPAGRRDPGPPRARLRAARRARPRCGSRSCPPTGPARRRTASTARRSRSAPATRRRSAPTTSPSARPTRTATRVQLGRAP